MSTRTPFLLVVLAGLSAVSGTAQTRLDIKAKDIDSRPFSADFASGGRLRMYLRSGDFHIVGTRENKIMVRVEGRSAWKAYDMQVRLEGSDTSASLTVSGGPRNDLQVTIEIPAKTSLFVRMTAGNLELNHVTGDKDAELHAGEMIIDVGDAANYSRVEASVYSGGLEASPFGESHGGLFRSFHKQGNGKYFLHAHVGAGDLTLQ